MGTYFVAMCCTKLLKTSSAASVTPNPTDCTCGAPSISPKSAASVTDCGCEPMLHRDLSLLRNQGLGFVAAFPDHNVVFTACTFLKYRFQHTGIHDVGHVECGCTLA